MKCSFCGYESNNPDFKNALGKNYDNFCECDCHL